MIKNIFLHTKLVCRHKKEVFKLMYKLGMPIQGIKHDLSKFSPTEFWESVKYYDGSRSPIEVSKEKNGYSLAWLHHKSRNKHHYFYWIDQYQEEGGIGLQMPYKYAVEMFCDMVAASKCYKRDKFTNDAPLNYFKTQNYGHFMHEGMKKFLSICFNNYAELGESEEWFNKEMMHIIYDSCFGGI